jgi:hypothetical protein
MSSQPNTQGHYSRFGAHVRPTRSCPAAPGRVDQAVLEGGQVEPKLGYQ